MSYLENCTLENRSIDSELTRRQTSTILNYVSDVFDFDILAICNFHDNTHDQYGILMRMIDKIEGLALEWNGAETSYNIFIEYDFAAVTFDFSLGLEETPVVIESHGVNGNKIEAILKTLYKLAHWHYNVYLSSGIIGYQINVDDSLKHNLHETFEVIQVDSSFLNYYITKAITKYPKSIISLQPVKNSEIGSPTFI